MIDNPQSKAHPVRRRVLATAAAVALATVTLTGLTGTPASAARASCVSGYLCFYPDPNYSGGRGKVSGNNSDFRNLSTSGGNCGNKTWDNCVSSAYNQGNSCTAYLYSGYGYSGVKHSLARGDGYPNLKNISFDDTLSSNSWC